MKNFTLLLLMGSMLVSCSPGKREDPAEKAVGLELNNMDTTIRAQDDFFRFVNGGWIAKTAIPADRGSWGSANELQESNNKILLDVLKNASENPAYIEGTDQRKASDFFSVGMDSAMAEGAGMKPLQETLDKIDAIKNKSDLQSYLIDQELEGGGAFFGFAVFPDLKNSQKMGAYINSGGIGLPERDYYLKTDQKSKETRDKYKEYTSKMLVLAGLEEAKARKSAERILVLEGQLAKSMLTKEETRDPVKQYNKKSIPELTVLTPSINWPVYFTALGVKEDSIIAAACASCR